ncbi:acyl-protein synthetase [Paenibacillus qinlingensis]|uniref:Phenylacetate-coenzyme A ligase PaaK-like adenylate-forming protein n=1 Tax=Paenibacillus qinlingensis TaxID=1837343 RepID=A0ABU1P3D9_9BACL|nr:acyl-protein synthetase [Paenibacillus qinlingensis]MDR6553582.1 phenylacetate-coenzyme A ligase PaaK-like adenylate-forming protein [Paenibacillus qinlingensis]
MNETIFQSPFEMKRADKKALIIEELKKLTAFHKDHCEPYEQILTKVPFDQEIASMEQMPYLPVQLFKMLDLCSVPKEEVMKTLTSSGTTSQQVSKIYINRETSELQSKALVSIVRDFIGKQRLPMIIIDTKNVIKDRKSFSARGAGIVGFSNFGRNHFYLLDDNMEIDWDGLYAFIEKHKGERIFLFGFTFMIWQYFFKICRDKNIQLPLDNSILIHGGGWKKLSDESVSNEIFKQSLLEQFHIPLVHNYYGMVEQVGSIFMECEHGHFHTPNFADVLIRDFDTLEPVTIEKKGIVQVISILPKSYPGHSLLTEDVGTLHGEDDCPCGRMGKHFTIEGRVPKAEIRGCSDTHAYDQQNGVNV